MRECGDRSRVTKASENLDLGIPSTTMSAGAEDRTSCTEKPHTETNKCC